MNDNCLEGRGCPKCGQTDEFLITAVMQVSLRDDGTDPYADVVRDLAVEYDERSHVRCPDCNFEGRFGDLLLDRQYKCLMCGGTTGAKQRADHFARHRGIAPAKGALRRVFVRISELQLFECSVCGEKVYAAGTKALGFEFLRQHLEVHHSQASGFSVDEVRNQFKLVE